MKVEDIEQMLDNATHSDSAVRALGYAICEQLRRDETKQKQQAINAIVGVQSLLADWVICAKKVDMPKDVVEQIKSKYAELTILRKAIEERV